ncbi:MAG: hypothetical protein ACWA47_03255 [Brevirhabdus sp.]
MEQNDKTGAMRVSDVVALAEKQFGRTVRKITAPGGRGRASARVHFDDLTVIATYRPEQRSRDMEQRLLEHFNGTDAPVPRLLGRQGDVLFQQDLGNLRMPRALTDASQDQARDIAAAGLTSLWRIKSIAEDLGIVDQLPVIAHSKDWALNYISAPLRLSRLLSVEPPELDHARVLSTLLPKPAAFVKWDARPGNAIVLGDGSVSWFDWEHYGRRGGYEDFPFLFGDEFWPLDAEASIEAFIETAPKDMHDQVPVLVRLTALQAAQRLSLINQRHNEKGWLEATVALGQDRVGTAPELVRNLARHGADWASRDPLVEPLANWFLEASNALLSSPGSES